MFEGQPDHLTRSGTRTDNLAWTNQGTSSSLDEQTKGETRAPARSPFPPQSVNNLRFIFLRKAYARQPYTPPAVMLLYTTVKSDSEDTKHWGLSVQARQGKMPETWPDNEWQRRLCTANHCWERQYTSIFVDIQKAPHPEKSPLPTNIKAAVSHNPQGAPRLVANQSELLGRQPEGLARALRAVTWWGSALTLPSCPARRKSRCLASASWHALHNQAFENGSWSPSGEEFVNQLKRYIHAHQVFCWTV